MGDNKVIKTTKPGNVETMLRQRFYNAVADQAALMDRLAQTLLTVELAIPGLYATILKLVSGEKTLVLSCPLKLAFLFWLLALLANLWVIFPKKYVVNSSEIRHSEASIESFFYNSANNKWRLLLISITFFIAGIGGVLWDIFL